MPNEGELFYGLVQDGNDLWNATFFCGSCAVIRRKPLLEIGGVAVETITRRHTHSSSTAGLRTLTWRSRKPQGWPPKACHALNQRIRWARGMAQIFTPTDPLLGKGEVGPAHLLRQRDALLLWLAAAGVPHRAAGLIFRRADFPCLGALMIVAVLPTSCIRA